MNLSTLISVLWPELVLTIAACVLFLLGVSNSFRVRGVTPIIAAAVLVGVFFSIWFETKPSRPGAPAAARSSQVAPADRTANATEILPLSDSQNTLVVGNFATYIKLITAGLGVLFVLMAWPTNREGTGNSARRQPHADSQRYLAVNTVESAIEAVRSGICFGWLPVYRIQEYLDSGELVGLQLPLGGERFARMHLIMRDLHPSSKEKAYLADLLGAKSDLEVI